MEILSPCFEGKWHSYETLTGAWPERREWLQALCQPPFRADVEASQGWGKLLPFLPGQPPTASSLDFEKAWSRLSTRPSLMRGLAALGNRFASLLENWFTQAPLRFLKLARMLGSVAPERGRLALERAAEHPFFLPQLSLPSENLGDVCLRTWSPLPPPSRVAEACGKQLSPTEEAELRQSIDNWMPVVQLEIVRYYCGAKANAPKIRSAPPHRPDNSP